MNSCVYFVCCSIYGGVYTFAVLSLAPHTSARARVWGTGRSRYNFGSRAVFLALFIGTRRSVWVWGGGGTTGGGARAVKEGRS